MTNTGKRLVYTLDDNYLIPFLVSVFSAKKVFGTNLVIVIVQPTRKNSEMGLSEKALEICTRSLKCLALEFEIVKVNTETFPESSLPTWARFSKTTWLRFYYLFNSDNLENVIYYVEADMIFLKCNPSIFEINLGGYALSARTSPGHEDFEIKWGANITRPWYFNGGVMVVDIQKWRDKIDQSIWWQAVSDFTKHEFRVIDQDTLNYFFRGTQLPMTSELNSYPSEFDQTRDSILHFAGRHKPWIFKPKILRIKETECVVLGMSIWDTLEREVIQTLRNDLNAKDLSWLKKSYPKVNLSTKMSILFPRFTSSVFKFKQGITLHKLKRIYEN